MTKHWEVLVVDDDPDVHAVTELALKRVEYRGRGVRVLSARDSSEARTLSTGRTDLAVVLLDIVLETETAGLEYIKWLRKEEGNALVQIVVRTAQDSSLPGDRVTIEYEINDYQEKAELTARKLRTSVITALRAYDALSTIDGQRRGLREVIAASAHVFRHSRLSAFERETLNSLASLLHGPSGDVRHSGVFAVRTPDSPAAYVTTATGRFKSLQGWKLSQIVDPGMYERILSHDYSQSYLSWENFRVYGFRLSDESVIYVILEDENASTEWKRDLLEAFRINLGVAVENFGLYRELESARNELVFALGEVAESRSEETGIYCALLSTHFMKQFKVDHAACSFRSTTWKDRYISSGVK